MPNSDTNKRKVALITGASAGLGLAIAKRFASAGFDLAIVGRDRDRLDDAVASISSAHRIETFVCDITSSQDVEQLFESFSGKYSRLDALVNNVGMSDRGTIKSLSADHLEELFQVNVLSALKCSQAAMPLLEKTNGQIVNIGSLAAKVAPRYLGGYAAAKHALAAITQQLRLESRELGVNVILVSPGPIQRSDAGKRYVNRVTDDMPASANRPAGGTSVKGLASDYVAEQIYRAFRRRSVDIILPKYLRPIIVVGHMIPPLGDRMLLWFTRNKSE